MSDIIPKVALYHAQQGNFSGFRVSIPLDLSEDNLIYLFNNIRDNMNLIFEETTSWFDFDELVAFYKISIMLIRFLYGFQRFVSI